MTECICCKQRTANITITGNAIIHVCGQSDCRSQEGETLGEWLLSGQDDPTGNSGYYYLIEDLKQIEILINKKNYIIPTDKRVIRGLANKIKEIAMKQLGNQTNN
jgi:hypothetical protein